MTTETPARVKTGKPTSPRKPRPRPARSVRLVELPAPESGNYFAIDLVVGSDVGTYLVHPMPCDVGGDAYQVEKLDTELNTVESYAVRIGAPRDCGCECKGFTYHGRCKHLEGLQALDKAGQLPRPVRQKHAACPGCGELVPAPGLCDRCEGSDEWFRGVEERQRAELMTESDYTDTDGGDCPF